MKFTSAIVVAALSVAPALSASADSIVVAVASNLKFAMDEIVQGYLEANPSDSVEVVYGSSGKFNTQIQQGAPFDVFISADMEFPRALAERGFAASDVECYAVGRMVLWSAVLDASKLTLEDLAKAEVRRIAIANPKHAPYGQRAEEALRATGLWESVESKLVHGDTVSHTAQFVETGNADVGIIALSLALSPELAAKGGYALIPNELHAPLDQGLIVTRRAAGNALAHRFAAHMKGPEARAVLIRFGLELPETSAGTSDVSRDLTAGRSQHLAQKSR